MDEGPALAGGRVSLTAPPRSSSQARPAIVFGLIGLGLGLLLIAAKEQLYALQGGVSEVANILPFGYAFGAGMLAAVNPCGVLLMPSLVAYYLGSTGVSDEDWVARAWRAFLFGIMATLGFVVLFALVGSLFAVTGRTLGQYFRFGGFAVGIGLTALGLWMVVTGHSFGLASASRAMGVVRLRNNLRSLFLFGIAYGVASLACTLPIFLVVVGTATVGGMAASAIQFLGYALGMGTMLTSVIVAAAFFSGAVTRLLKRAVPHMHRASAALLLGAGIYIVYYWLPELIAY
jgi:cytochrome c biogenesis protein CcdA